MNNFRTMLLGMACSGLLATPVLAQEAKCAPEPGRAPIKVSVGADKMPIVTPDTVSACEGETVRWVFQGSEAKEFSVLFTSVADSPFDWENEKGATVTGTVKSGAAKGGQQTPYKYDVAIDGKVLDPRIIVDP